ncbi:CopG family ribbon-helix-helix protein [Salana multivorans]
MAKVMISLPDDVLADLDRQAAARNLTRSGYIRELTEDAAQQREALRASRIAAIFEQDGPAPRRGGNVAELVKEGRPRWPKD